MGQVVSAGPVVAVHPPGGRPTEQGGALPLPLRLPRPHPGERRPLLSAALIQDRHTVRQAGEHARQKVSEIIVCLSIGVYMFVRQDLSTHLSIHLSDREHYQHGFFFIPPSTGCLTARLSVFLVSNLLITFLFTGCNHWLILILIL
jgi:hypothetical protein